MELLEALQILYRGQSNVAVMANQLDIDSDVWKLDIEMSWPYIT